MEFSDLLRLVYLTWHYLNFEEANILKFLGIKKVDTREIKSPNKHMLPLFELYIYHENTWVMRAKIECHFRLPRWVQLQGILNSIFWTAKFYTITFKNYFLKCLYLYDELPRLLNITGKYQGINICYYIYSFVNTVYTLTCNLG